MAWRGMAWRGYAPAQALRCTSLATSRPTSTRSVIDMGQRAQRQRSSLRLQAHRGHWIGGAVSILALAGCVLSVHLGAHPAVSVALVSLPVVAINQRAAEAAVTAATPAAIP